MTAAAVKLLPVDAADAARWLVEAEPLIASLAEQAVRRATRARSRPGSRPRSSCARSRHAAREGRLFAS